MQVYRKLVRDLIPFVIQHNGEHPVTHVETDDEKFLQRLSEKLHEEVGEFLADSRDPKELADILEVVEAVTMHVETLAKKLGVSRQQLLVVKNRKKLESGGFEGRIVLDEVHSGPQ